MTAELTPPQHYLSGPVQAFKALQAESSTVAQRPGGGGWGGQLWEVAHKGKLLGTEQHLAPTLPDKEGCLCVTSPSAFFHWRNTAELCETPPSPLPFPPGLCPPRRAGSKRKEDWQGHFYEALLCQRNTVGLSETPPPLTLCLLDPVCHGNCPCRAVPHSTAAFHPACLAGGEGKCCLWQP